MNVSVIIPTIPERKWFLTEYALPSLPADVEIIIMTEGSVQDKRNVGASMATNDFLFFMDDDTILAPDCLSKMVDEIGAADFCYCDFRGSRWPGGKRAPYYFKSQEWDPVALRKKNYISTMSLVRADSFPGFDVSIQRYQDWDLWLTMLEKGCYGKYIPECLFTACYIDAGISASGNKSELLNVVRRKHGL